jgi:thioesterase domain-containing protein
MSQHYIQLIKEIQIEGPYLLGGWSLGGIIAYEMAQQLHTTGDEVEILILIDSIFPNKKQDQPNDTEKTPDEKLEDEDGFYIEEKVKKLLEVNLKESGKLTETYIPEKYLQGGAVVLLKAEDGFSGYIHQNHAYQKELISQITVQAVTGTHATLFDIDHLENTSLKIYESIQKIRRRRPNK